MNPLKRFLTAAVAVLAFALPAQAQVFWDDEAEPGNTGYTLPSGAMVFDTVVKFSGSASIRYNFPSVCYPDASAQNNCGGFADRQFTPTEQLYRRVYVRFSPGFTPSDVFTKMFRSDTWGIVSNWWTIGSNNFQFKVHNQSVLINGVGNLETQTVPTSFSFGTGQWYCVETREKLNTPGQLDGEVQVWIDGVQYLLATGLYHRQPGDTSMFYNHRLYRQTGIGSIWFDRIAVGASRIGCLGAGGGGGDTTPPPVPTAPTVPSTNLPATYNWTAVTNPGDLEGYNIYRKLEACSGGAALTLLVTLGNVLTYTDTTIPVDTTAICVKVASRDTSQNVSAQSAGTTETLTPPSPILLSHVVGLTTDPAGADLTFSGAAYKYRYWYDLTENSKIEVVGIGGNTSARLNKVWEAQVTFMCAEAQGSSGVWETDDDPASYRCTGVTPGNSDTTAPATPTGFEVE